MGSISKCVCLHEPACRIRCDGGQRDDVGRCTRVFGRSACLGDLLHEDDVAAPHERHRQQLRIHCVRLLHLSPTGGGLAPHTAAAQFAAPLLDAAARQESAGRIVQQSFYGLAEALHEETSL